MSKKEEHREGVSRNFGHLMFVAAMKVASEGIGGNTQ